VLTTEGEALMRQAREVVGAMDQFKSSARGLAGGREPELSIAIEVLFPIQALTHAVAEFHAAFPETPLRIYVEVLGAVLQPVLDGRCSLCVMNSIALAPGQLATEAMCAVPMVVVAAASHPLAAIKGPIDQQTADQHVQLVLTDRSALTEGREFGVFGEKTWRLADLGAKHAFLKAGLGWGGMPKHLVQPDIDAAVLVPLDLTAFQGAEMAVRMAAAWRIDAPPGIAGRWMIDRLRRGGEDRCFDA
jgi:DNA-binding transcriptional LysR family regulator